MSLIIKAKHVTLTPELQDYISKKTGKFYSFFDKREIQKIEVIIEKKSYKDKTLLYKSQITLWLLGHTILRAEKEQPSAQAAFDVSLEKIEHQISRYKGRFQARVRQTRKEKQKGKIIFEPDVDFTEKVYSLADFTEVKRTKKFKVTPMFVAEAIAQMELLDHNFFIFLNKETNKLSVVYRRHNPDDEYGLLEPEW